MENQNYCMINLDTNVCENICHWDGNLDTWTPPSNYLMLAQSTTPTKIWVLGADKTKYVLSDSVGNGDIGWTWDGVYLTTTQPQPKPLGPQPVTEGTQTI